MDPAAPPAPATRRSPRRRLAGLSTVAGLLLGGLTCAFVARELVSEWSRVRDAVATASPAWVAVGLGLSALAMASIGWVWADVLRLVGAPVSRPRALGWYFVGELGKYLPGGVWPVLGRGEMARRGGVAGSPAYASVALSLVTLYLGAMVAAVALLPFALGGDGPGRAVLVLVLLPLGLLVLHPRVVGTVLGRVRRLTGRPLPLPVPRWGEAVGTVLRYLPTWALVGGATAAVAHAVDPSASPARVAFAAVLSWVAGFLAVPVPAGAGVREAVFVAACGLSPELGATVAVATRVLFIVVDAGGAGLALALLRRASVPGADAGPLSGSVGSAATVGEADPAP